MGILANTVSVCHYRVEGDLPREDLFSYLSGRLAQFGFLPIDHGSIEQSLGWVHLEDHRQSDFSVPAAFWREHYLFCTLRLDRRRIPTAVLRAHLQQAEETFLSANPGFSRVPKQKREELRDAVRGALLSRTLPVPSTYDAIWDTRSGVLTLATLGAKSIDLFETQFKKTFEGLRLVAIHPYARAVRVVDEALLPALQQANRASSEAILEQIRDNRWIGWEFLLWVLYRTLNGSSEYRVTQAGPALAGEPFVAYLDERMVLTGTGDGGTQKITTAGPQDRFGEVRTALRNGKRLTEATIYLERGDQLWRTTLKGELFQFASFKSPRVQLERDDTVDPMAEREGLFFERMALLETGLQLFDSLFAAFLIERLGPDWTATLTRIDDWLAEP